MTSVTKAINVLEFDENTPSIFATREKFVINKDEVIELTQELNAKIIEYQKFECAEEYYRYIFERDKDILILKHDKIELDFTLTHSLFFETKELIDSLLIKLRDITYIYPTL